MSLKFKEAFVCWLFQRRILPASNIREKPTSLRPSNPPQGQSLKSRVKKGVNMQEIEYENGKKTKDYFDSLFEALEDAKEKDKIKPIKKVTVTRFIPKKRK